MNLRGWIVLGCLLLVGTGCPHGWMKGGTSDRAMHEDTRELVSGASEDEEEKNPCAENEVATWKCDPLPCRWVCEKREDCEAPLGCLPLSSRGPNFCVASECETDRECAEGLACRVLETLGEGPRVRFCVPEGRRKEGGPCLRGASIHKVGYPRVEEGRLRLEMECVQPCGEGKPSCPEGSHCLRGRCRQP